MIAKSYYRKRGWVSAFIWLLVLFFITPNQFVQAQQQTNKALDSIQPARLSADAQARIADTITRFRQNKGVAGEKSAAQRQTLQALRQQMQATAAVTTYSNPYFDTQAGDDFSFPEDTHDFCRAYFGTDSVQSDYYLNSRLDAGESLVVSLTWDTPADYDLYLFDLDGFPVGDPDPDADFDGTNGTDVQNAATPFAGLVEEALISHSRASADRDSFVVVVDRFRGTASNALTLTVSGNDDVFEVLEYVASESFTAINALSDEAIGPVTDGASFNLDDLGARPNFNIQFNTDGCAESIVFTLINTDTGESTEFTDDDLPYALFGDTDGDYNAGDLADGTYMLIATPYSEDGGEGASADPQDVTFAIVGNRPPAIESYSLIDAVADEPIAGFDPIMEGGVIDLVALFDLGFDITRLNLRANVFDPGGDIEQVASDLVIALFAGGTETVNAVDDAADYSVYGDDNAGDFADAALPVGIYALSGVAQVAGEALAPLLLNFEVIGPRIGSYTLIDADTEQPIAGFDPIREGAVIDMNAIGTPNINIRANTVDFTPPVIESTRLILVGPNGTIQNRVESFRPYAVFGDPSSMDLDDDDPTLDYNVWSAVQNGDLNLNGVPFGLNGGVGETFGPLTLNFSIVNAIAGRADVPAFEPSLLPNYPNPFNPVTAIRFNLPETAPVRLEVFDMLGRSVMILVDATLDGGFHEVNFEAGELSSGMYLYRLETPGFVRTRPMTLLK